MDVNLTSESRVKLQRDAQVPFTYEVEWKTSNIPFEDRFDKYLDPNFFQHRVSNSGKDFFLTHSALLKVLDL